MAANDAAVGSAAAGTALGALAGAAIGSLSGKMGAGAAIGAGTGLVAGSAVGAGNARAAGGSMQVRYDTVYAQCMAAKGIELRDRRCIRRPITEVPVLSDPLLGSLNGSFVQDGRGRYGLIRGAGLRVEVIEP